jgi:hypothetical protein
VLRLIVPWDEAPAFMIDEQGTKKAVEVADRGIDEPTMNADTRVIGVLGLDSAMGVDTNYRTFLILTVTDLEAVRRALPVSLDDLLFDPMFFADRNDQLRISSWRLSNRPLGIVSIDDGGGSQRRVAFL